MSESEIYCPVYAPFFGFAGVFAAVKYSFLHFKQQRKFGDET